MLPIPTSSQLFAPDQQFAGTVTYWDTPQSVLYNSVASDGLQLWVRQPRASDGVFSLTNSTGTGALQAATPANCATTFLDGTYSDAVVTDGRIGNVIQYWAGGAPGVHGVSSVRQVAYRFRGTLRSTTGRGWFNTNNAISNFCLGLAGQGWVRVILNSTTEVFAGAITEAGFLATGPSFSSTFTFTTGDVLDIYYVQNGEAWGGLVVKACIGPLPAVTAPAARRLVMRAAPVLGCGLVDDGVAPTAQTLSLYDDLSIDHQVGRASRATLSVPLVNPDNNDGIGWIWVKNAADPVGHLTLSAYDTNRSTLSTTDVRRGRLVRIQVGFTGELYTSFTGFVDDFEVSDGRARITCVGIEQRMADQFVKNYPDKISYMCYAYNRLTGTSEPVYDIPAYDNWAMEDAIRDLLVRGGIDESRTRVPLYVPNGSGGTTAVTM